MKKSKIIIIFIIIALADLFITYDTVKFDLEKPEKISFAKTAAEKYVQAKGVKSGEYALTVDYRMDSKLLGHSGYVIKIMYKDEPDVTYNYDYINNELVIKSAADVNNPGNKDFKHQ